MQSESNNSASRNYFRMRRAQQITDSHCGPAVIQMLLSNLDIEVTQQQVAAAGGAENFIEMHGMRVDQLAQAVKTLAPDAQFWYKDSASLDDLRALVLKHQYPVGVEWQGVFEDEGEDDPEPDYGHYSIIADINNDTGQLTLVDPYRNYYIEDRIFDQKVFEERWIDWNYVTDPATGIGQLVTDHHMLFIVTPNGETFPERLGLKRN
jgi:hypothetical protein